MFIRLPRQFHKSIGSRYSVWKEVVMHNVIHSARVSKCSRFCLSLGLVVLFVLVPILSANAQAVEFKTRVFETLIELPDEYFALLVELAGILNDSEDSRVLFMETPRDFLLNEGIDLPRDAFQITGVDFSLLPAVEDEPWFGIAEPLEDFVFEPKGLGVFLRNVAIFIQEAFEPVEEGTAVEETDHQTDMLRFIGDRFPGDTLDRLSIVMRELDEMDPEDSRRLEFLANPREYLIGQDLTLPAYSYRVIAIDLNRAEAAGSVVSDELRAGLGTVREGIGVFHNNVGMFLQRAI